MKKLELKHLAPYLPYGLKLQTGVIYRNSIITLRGNTLDNCFAESSLVVKPILKPLSDLDKYISKLDFRAENDVQFTYYDGLPNQLTITATYKLMGEVYTDFIVNRNSFKNVDYWIVEKLFEHHFDVFGLIDKELAIDINKAKEGLSNE